MRFTQAVTDLYKSVRKEAEATGAIPKPKPKPKPKTQKNVAEFELNGERYVIEWDGVGDDADVERVVNGVKAQVAGGAATGAQFGAKQIPTTQPKPQPAPRTPAPKPTGNPILDRIQQGTTTQGVQQAVDVFREEARKNPDVTAAMAKIPTATEVALGRKAGESAGQYASRKSEEFTKDVMNSPAFTALYELFGKPGAGGLAALGLKPKELAAGVVASPYDMSLDIGVLLSQSATAQEKAGAIVNLFGTDLAGPLLGKAIGVAAKAVKNKQAAKALAEGLKAFDLTMGPNRLRAVEGGASALDEALPGVEFRPNTGRAGLTDAQRQAIDANGSRMDMSDWERSIEQLQGKKTEQMPPPVAMAETSPVRGLVGETVPRIVPNARPWQKVSASIRDRLASRGVRGDKLEDAIDLGEEIYANGGKIDANDGYVTLYHRTSRENAEAIVRDQSMVSKEDRLFFGSSPTGQIDGYGDAVVKVRIPLEKLEISDVFANEIHVAMPSGKIGTRNRVVAELFDVQPSAPTTARYGPSYGTPQPGQGQRVGYPMQFQGTSALDEALPTKPAETTPVAAAAPEQNGVQNRISQALKSIDDFESETKARIAQMSDSADDLRKASESLDRLPQDLRSVADKARSDLNVLRYDNGVGWTSINGATQGERLAALYKQFEDWITSKNPDIRAYGQYLREQILDNGNKAESELFRKYVAIALDHVERRGQSLGNDYRGKWGLLGTSDEVRQLAKDMGLAPGDSEKFFYPKNWTDEVQNANTIRAGSEVPRMGEVSGDAKPAAARSIDLLPSDKSAANANRWAELLWWNGYDGNNPSVTAGEAYIKQVFGSKAELNRRIKAAVKSGELPSTPKDRRVQWEDKHGHDVGASVQYNLVKREDFAKWLDGQSKAAPEPQAAATGPVGTRGRQSTGLANVVQDAEADAGMIASSPRATGTKAGEAQAKGKAAVESGQIDPETLAAEIASGKRTFKDETEVGALMEGKRRILDKINRMGAAIDEAHARGEDATELIAARDKERANLQTYLENVQAGKGKWSDIGRSLQEGTTVNEGDYEAVLAEFRRNKPDGKVSERESNAIKDLVDQHNATKEELARVESELAQLKAVEGAAVIARKGTPGRRSVTQIRAERQQVSESIRKSIEQAIVGGPVGSGLGGLENLFDVAPQLARDLRKLIELYIEEFKVGRLNSEFYVGAKQVIRDALGDIPDEALDQLGVNLKDLSDDEVNRILGGIYDVKQSRTKNEVQARIAELKKQAELLAKIEGAKEGEVLKAGTPPPPASPTVKELRASLNELLKSIGEDPSMTGVRTRLQNILDDLSKQSAGKYRHMKDNKSRVMPADIQAIREQIASVRRDMRLEDTLADIDEQLRTGNFKTPNKRIATLTAEQERIKAQIDMKRARVRAAIESAKPKTVADTAFAIANLPRTLKASVDISAPGRQGWILGIANPKSAARAFGDQMRALATEEGAVVAQNRIMQRPNVGLYKRSDLYLAPIDGALNTKEEAFIGAGLLDKWRKMNPVRASDRAYAAYLNRLRADSFDSMVKALGHGPTDEQLRSIARYINVASGRGDLGLKGSPQFGKSINQAMPAAAAVFWSPRNMVSRIQFATGLPLFQAAKVPGARKVIAREYAKSIIATGAVIGLGKMAVESETAKRNGLGGTVGTDISSSDFGKIRSGDTRIDVMAGVQQPLVLIGRLITGKSTSPVSGKVVDLKNPKYGEPGPGDIVTRFLKSKANPVLTSAEQFYTGKDFVGQPTSKGKAVADLFAPLSAQEIYEALTEEGVEKEDAYTLLNIFGISTARFKDKEKTQN